MSKIYFSSRKNLDSLAKVGNKFYRKSKIYSSLKKLKKNKRIVGYDIKNNKDRKVIKVFVKSNKYYEVHNIYMLKSDPYYKKIKFLLIKNPFKKLFAILGLAFMFSFAFKKKTVLEIIPQSIEEEIEFDDLFSLYENDLDIFKEDTLLERYCLKEADPYISSFNVSNTIEKVMIETYTDDNSHQIDKYIYDASLNNIDKSKLLNLLIVNSTSNQMSKGLGYVCFSKEELINLVDDIYTYIEKMKLIDPNFDVNYFACSLENSSFYKNPNYTDKFKSIYGFYLDYAIVYNTFSSEYMSFEKWVHVTNHEVTHMAQSFCPCETKKLKYAYKNGSNILKNTINEKDIIQPYSYTFLSENFAEDVASLMDFENITTYLSANQIADNLEFALLVNPDYEVGTILKNSIERDPIGFYQNFPYLYDRKEELTKYVCMLKSYDYALGNDLDEYLKIMSLDNSSKACDSFKNYAFIEHINLFYKNLYILNETYDNVSSYSMDLINLFNSLMIKENTDSFDSFNEPLVEYLLIDSYNEFKDNYLSIKYPNISFSELDDISSMKVDEISYPDFVSSSKRNFINNLIDNYDLCYGVSKTNVLKK